MVLYNHKEDSKDPLWRGNRPCTLKTEYIGSWLYLWPLVYDMEVIKMKKLFVVREIGKGINEEYHMMMTNEEMTTYLKALFAPKHSFPPVF